jgi:hypothetical protein
MRTCARPSPPAAGYLNDVYRFSAAANTWTAVSTSGSSPSPRVGMGFEATPDGMLYVFGGTGGTGGNRTGEGGGSSGACGWFRGLLSLSSLSPFSFARFSGGDDDSGGKLYIPSIYDIYIYIYIYIYLMFGYQ